jgi:hypothetical protein
MLVLADNMHLGAYAILEMQTLCIMAPMPSIKDNYDFDTLMEIYDTLMDIVSRE